MTQILSPHKVSRIMSLYFEGYTQSYIAEKLNVDQSTVSLHVGKFKTLVHQRGIQAAEKEYDIVYKVEALHSLSSELRKAGLTIEEAAIGLKMELSFQKYGVKQENYKDLIQACKKMKTDGFLDASIELSKLESETGMTYDDIIAHTVSTNKQLKKAEQDLQVVISKLGTSKKELARIDKKKNIAKKELEAQMLHIGVDMNRLKLVEGLAVSLKEAGISDKEMEDYISNQQLLNKAGISIDRLAEILNKVKVLTTHDQGKDLLSMLSEYDGLTNANKLLQHRQSELRKQVDDLEEKAILKNDIEKDVAKLKTEKTNLEEAVANLSSEKKTLLQMQNDVKALNDKKAALQHSVKDTEKHKDQLVNYIDTLERKTYNLKGLEIKYNSLSKSLIEIQSELDSRRNQLEVLNSFIGFINPSSYAEIEKFVSELPSLVTDSKEKGYSPEILRDFTLSKLSGGTLQLSQCVYCKAKFTVDKQPQNTFGYKCPVCSCSVFNIVKKEAEIIKDALTEPAAKVLVPRLVNKIVEATPITREHKS